MSERSKLEALREFASTKWRSYLLVEDYRIARMAADLCSALRDEIDRLLAELYAEPTLREAFEAGQSSVNIARTEYGPVLEDTQTFADWLKRREAKCNT